MYILFFFFCIRKKIGCAYHFLRKLKCSHAPHTCLYCLSQLRWLLKNFQLLHSELSNFLILGLIVPSATQSMATILYSRPCAGYLLLFFSLNYPDLWLWGILMISSSVSNTLTCLITFPSHLLWFLLSSFRGFYLFESSISDLLVIKSSLIICGHYPY